MHVTFGMMAPSLLILANGIMVLDIWPIAYLCDEFRHVLAIPTITDYAGNWFTTDTYRQGSRSVYSNPPLTEIRRLF
jgi:hypothetical protein